MFDMYSSNEQKEKDIEFINFQVYRMVIKKIIFLMGDMTLLQAHKKIEEQLKTF